MKIGIMGGSFNPIHNAHLTLAKQFVEQLELDKCLIVPAYVSPFKTEDKNRIDSYYRIMMIEAAIKQTDCFALCRFELDREQVSYTIDTINHLAEQHPKAELFLLIGTDQAVRFEEWKDYQEIASKARICILNRPDNPVGIEQRIETLFQKFETKANWIDAPIIPISSTLVRERIKNGESISGLVPLEVEKIILENELYV